MLHRPLVLNNQSQIAQLPSTDFLRPTQIGVSDGDTSPDPGGIPASGVVAWSTITECAVHWDGSAWRILAVPHSLNTIRDGQIVTIPEEHNLLVVGTLDIQGSGVVDGSGNILEVS